MPACALLTTISLAGCGGASPSLGNCAGPPPHDPARAASTCWRPYAADSPFNRRIPQNPPLAPDSAAIVHQLTSEGPPASPMVGLAGTPEDFGHPAYYPSRGDPVYTLHCTRPWGRCPIEGDRVAIPSGARPAGGSDAHMAIVDLASGWEYDLWQAATPDGRDGRLDLSWGGRTRIDGSGLGSNATAAHFGLLAGIIRAPELRAGHIDHALLMVTRCTDGYVPPAAGGGSHCDGTPNAPKAGMRFQLDMSDAEIDRLPAPRWKRTILHALADYGAIIGDTGGVEPWGIEFESGSTYTSLGNPDELVQFARAENVPQLGPTYLFDFGSGIDWAQHLRVVAPCVSVGHC